MGLVKRTGHCLGGRERHAGRAALIARVLVALVLALAACAGVSSAPARAGSQPSAQLPRVFLDTTYVPPGGRVIDVPAGGDLQNALDQAAPGDQVVLEAGATFSGNFVLPEKKGAGLIVVRTSNLQALSEGVRVGPSDAADLARIVTPDEEGAVVTAPGAHEWRFIGIEFTVAESVSENTGVVRLGSGAETSVGQLPRDIVLDRCWVHGNTAQNDRRGVALNGISEAVVDSTVADFHEVGYDAQAIAGWNGPGPFQDRRRRA